MMRLLIITMASSFTPVAYADCHISGWFGGFFNHGMHGGGWMFWILLLLIGGFIAWLISRRGLLSLEDALTTLEKRYARGEISEEEFIHMQNQIG